MLIPHQANLRINEMVAKLLRIDESKVHNNIQKYGNTTAATIPLCLLPKRASSARSRRAIWSAQWPSAPALPGALC